MGGQRVCISNVPGNTQMSPRNLRKPSAQSDHIQPPEGFEKLLRMSSVEILTRNKKIDDILLKTFYFPLLRVRAESHGTSPG